jgi:hypothetical protein
MTTIRDDEARLYLCPLSTVRPRIMMGDPTDGAQCCGSMCMFWRWAAIKGDALTVRPGDVERMMRRNPGQFVDDGPVSTISPDAGRRLIYQESVGYCGMAGEP